MRSIRILFAGLLAAAAVGMVAPGAGADSASETGGAISIPLGGNATPFPSTIATSDIGGVVTSVEVGIIGLTHEYVQDIDLVLEGPGGMVVLHADCADGLVTDIDISFADGGDALGGSLVDGTTYAPNSCGGYSGATPTGPFGASLAALNGTDPNGAWNLYVFDDIDFLETGPHSIDSWTLDITTSNTAPVTSDGSYTATEDTPLVVSDALGLASTTVDPDDDDVITFSATQPANGTLVVAPDGSFTYTPDPDFNGEDTFTYTADDGVAEVIPTGSTYEVYTEGSRSAPPADRSGDRATEQQPTIEVERPNSGEVRSNAISNTSTITVTVQPANDPPVAVDDTAETTSGTAVTIDAVDNDTDIDGDTLTVDSVSAPVNGAVVFDGGDVTYVPNDDFVGTEVLDYTVTDGTDTDDATITITVTAPEVEEEDEEETPATTATTTTTTTAAVAATGTLPVTGSSGGPLGEYGMFAIFVLLSGVSFATAGAIRARVHHAPRHLGS